MTLQPGDTLSHRYQIRQELGGGGMARVYLATDMRLGGRQMAVKEMDPANVVEEERAWAVAGFRREAEVVARLNHRGIARVTDFFEEEGLYYLVMEYVEGETLEAALRRSPGGLPEDQVLAWAGQLASVLDYLHNRPTPIIFRDLKPDNIIVQEKGTLKLIDFGIARYFKPGQTQDTVQLGTPGYAAPEQSSQEGQSDPRTDVYSFGVLLHQLLTGYDPATTPLHLPPAGQLNPALSARVAAAIGQATHPDVEERFRSVRAFAAALGTTVGTPATPSPPVPPDPTELLPPATGNPLWNRWLALHPVGRVAAIVTGVGALILVALALLNNNGIDEPVAAGGTTATATASATPAVTVLPTGNDLGGGSADGEVTDVPTVTATVETPTPPPPTETPSPTPTWTPIPTLTPAPETCSNRISSAVATLYQPGLGCPTNSGNRVYSALADFERGIMLWRSDSRRIYAIYDNGSWASYRDTWQEGDPTFSCGTPSNPPTPIRGFGKVWCTHSAVQRGLGAATTGEWEATTTIQDFANGTILRTGVGDFVLYRGGNWTR